MQFSYENVSEDGKAIKALAEATSQQVGSMQIERLHFVLHLLDKAVGMYPALTEEHEDELFTYSCSKLYELRQPLIKKNWGSQHAEQQSFREFEPMFWKLIREKFSRLQVSAGPLFAEEQPKPVSKAEELKAKIAQAQQMLTDIGKPKTSHDRIKSTLLYKDLERLQRQLREVSARVLPTVTQARLF